MCRVVKLFVVLLICFFFKASVVQATTVTANSTATILETLSVVEIASLNFGGIVKSELAGTVTLGADGSLTDTTSTYQFAGTATPGIISISGSNNTFISVSFGSGTLSGSASSLPIRDFTHDAGTAPQLDSEGNLTVNVGAALDIASDQSAGDYTGIYTVTVNYQ